MTTKIDNLGNMIVLKSGENVVMIEGVDKLVIEVNKILDDVYYDTFEMDFYDGITIARDGTENIIFTQDRNTVTVPFVDLVDSMAAQGI